MVETKIDEQAAAFRALHEGDAFVMVDPWDVGSARILEALGFRALGTTVSGAAFARGRLEAALTVADLTEHVRAITSATRVPVSADMASGLGAGPDAAARAVQAAATGGAVGVSIGDSDPRTGLYPLVLAADRIAAAADAADELGHDFILTASADNFSVGEPDLDATIARLVAYEQAGADVLCAPGLRTVADIGRVCAAVSRPVAVLARADLSGPDMVAAGAQRIGVGAGLMWSALRAMVQAAERVRDQGDFSELADPPPLSDWLTPRRSS